MLSKGWGGAERYFVELCMALLKEGHEVQAICRPQFSRLHLMKEVPGLTLDLVKASWNYDLPSFLRIRNLVSDFSPQLIHTHLSRSSLMGGWAGRKLGIPVITKTANFIKPKYIKYSDWFICTTDALSNHISGFGIDPSRIRVIPNFSSAKPIETISTRDSRPLIFVSMGRFVHKKGFDTLIDAFHGIIKKGIDARLVIGGAGKQSGSLTEQVQKSGISELVEFPGWIEDPVKFMDSGDVFVLPSRDEPFGIVVLEAMARGKPIIATRSGVVQDVLEAENAAWCVPPGDTASLTHAMEMACGDRKGRLLKGSKALELFRSNFSLEAVLPRVEDLYEEVTTLGKKLDSNHLTGKQENGKLPVNILIVRLSAIGDIVMASPLIGAFRRSLPESRLSWLVESPLKAILEANPDLHEVIVWPRNRWRELTRKRRYWTLVREVITFIRDLRRRNFDMVVDAQGLFKSGIWAYLSGAPERVGIGSKEGSQHLMTQVVDRSGASDKISSQYLLLAEALGLDVNNFRMNIPLSEDAKSYGNRFASTLDGPYAVFCPFTTRPQKHWFNECWEKLLDLFTNEMGLDVVLVGGPTDRTESERIMPMETPRWINLTGKTSLQQAAAVMKQAALVVGVDTGLTHMGIALDVPTIALFGATAPYLNTEGTSGVVLYHPHECSPCRRNPTCEGLFPCMDAISTDEVIQTASDLLRAR